MHSYRSTLTIYGVNGIYLTPPACRINWTQAIVQDEWTREVQIPLDEEAYQCLVAYAQQRGFSDIGDALRDYIKQYLTDTKPH
jgi:hypothetical protein